MTRAIITFALFFFTQLLLWWVADEDNIASGDEVFIATAAISMIMFIYFAGVRWTRWILGTLLGIFALLAASLTLQGFSVGFLAIAVLYGAVILMIFRRQPFLAVPMRSKSLDEPIDEVPLNSQQPVEGGFYFGEVLYKYPLLVKRYQSLLIDFMLLGATIIMTIVIVGESEFRQTIMILLGASFVFLYEPILTVYSATIGQQLMGIRVRNINNPEKRINLLQAYIRLIVKWMLGWMSFITINFNDHHRAIHDMAGSSVVIKLK
jgi:hypothetical protein